MFVTRRLAQMTWGGIAGFLAVVALAGVVVFFWVARTVNTAPAQCATCHPELTAMWHRSQGHPADRVTCYECHAQHAEAPDSLNVGAFVRDQLIPEKYLSADERVQARCEGCHAEMRSSGTGRELVAAKYGLREALAAVSGLDAGGRRVALDRQALDLDGGAVQATVLLGAAVRSLRDAEWRSAARAAGLTEELSALGADLEGVSHAIETAAVTEDLLAQRMKARIDEKLGEVREGARKIGQALASAEEALAGVPAGKELSRASQAAAQQALADAGNAMSEVVRARVSVGRTLASETAVADPSDLKALLGQAEAAVQERRAADALEAVRAARGLLATPLENQQVIERRVAELAAANVSRISASVDAAGRALRAAAADLPRGAVAAGPVLTVKSAALQLLPRAETEPAGVPKGSTPPGPEVLAKAAAKGLEGLRGAVDGIAELEFADLGLDAEAFSALMERADKLAAALAPAEGAGQVRVRVLGHLETALFALPGAAAEDRLALTFAVQPVAPGAAVSLDLAELLDAVVVPFRDLELAAEQRKVIQVNHKLHLVSARDELGQPLGLGCLSCHRNIAHDKAQVETNRPTMAGCFTGECHRKDRNKDNCRRCHYQQLTEPGQEVL